MDVDGHNFHDWQKNLSLKLFSEINFLLKNSIVFYYSLFYRKMSLTSTANIYQVSNVPNVNQVSSVIT